MIAGFLKIFTGIGMRESNFLVEAAIARHGKVATVLLATVERLK